MLVARLALLVPLNVTVVPLITIELPLTNVGFAIVPVIVGCAICHALDPTSTHALLLFL